MPTENEPLPLCATEEAIPIPNPSTVKPPPPQADSVRLSDAPAAAPLQPADYEILGELGRGGMGVVYQARDRKSRRVVALKTLKGMDPDGLYRFKQEFRTLADIAHPNLVTLHELVSDGQQWFFSMELVEGHDFLSHVRAEPATGATRLRDALRQLAAGLSALHTAGQLHRDVKPSNVLVTSAGRVVLLDFGLAAELDAAGMHESTVPHLLGTISYMSPEQAASLPVSPATDWYSVGIMLYEALTGRLPYKGGVLQVLRDKQDIDPPPPREVTAGVPEDLDRLCMELLRRDPAARPTGQEILARLGEGGVEKALTPAARSRPPFVGREAHLRTLTEAFQAARQGKTVVVSVHGTSGTGKTALVQHFLDDLAEKNGAVLLAGRCYEQESVPYKALDSLIDALSRYLARLPLADAQALLPRDVQTLARVFPVLRRVEAVAHAPTGPSESGDPHEARRRAAAALRELLARLGDRRPLVLFIDDLQWGDLDGAALLGDLLRPPDPPALLLIGAYRSEDAAGSPFLHAYLGSGGAAAAAPDRREVEVAPLAPAEASDLALTILGRTDAVGRARAEAVAQESGGSPFFVYELVQHLLNDNGESNDAALDQVLWARISRLPTEARQLLETTAVAGRPTRLGGACRAAGVEAETALAPLRSGRLLRVQHDCIDAYHDRVRETVLAHLAPDDLADRHRRLAEVLEKAGETDPEVLAVHFHGAGLAAQAARYYANAADQAADALAFDHAAGLYRQALQLNPTSEGDKRTLRIRLGDALANAGRGAESAREYLAAVPDAAGAEALDLQRRAALQLLVSGHVDEGISTLGPVLAAVGMRLHTTPFRALLSLLFRRAQLWLRGVGFRERSAEEVPPEDLERIDICWSVVTGLMLIDPIRSAAFLTRGLLLALRAREPIRIARALAFEGAHTTTAGWWAKGYGMKLLGVAGEIARRHGNPYALGIANLAEGAAAYCEGSWRAGLESSDRAEQIFRDRCVGVSWELDTARTFSLWCLNFMGEMAELSRRCHDLIAEARNRGDLFVLTNVQTFNMAVVRLAADDTDGGRGDLDDAVGHWSQQGYHVQHQNVLLGRVHIELYAGNADAARKQVVKNWLAFWNSLMGQIQNARIQEIQMRAYSALALAVNCSDSKPMLREAEWMARRLQRERHPWPDALALYIRAAIASLRNDPAARKKLNDAADAFQTADMRLYAAAVRRRLGRLIGGVEGRALIEQADAWMTGQTIRNPARMTAVFAPGFPD
jgi:eukaryotic-like serine/threonine-protein kinase